MSNSSPPVRVLYCCHADNYHIQTWSAALSKHGAEITHLTLRPMADNPFRQIVLSGVGKTIRYWDFLTLAPQIRHIFKSGDFDILFASFANTYGLSAMMSGIRPHIIQTWSRDIGADRSVTGREHLMNETIGLRVLSNADAITTDGAHFRDFLLEKHPEFAPKTLATGWGIDLSHFSKVHDADRKKTVLEKWDIPADAPVFTSIRGIFWYYQPEIVFPALSELLKTHSDLHVLLPTLGHPLDPSLDDQFRDLKNHERVIVFEQLLSSQEMIDVWSITDVFLSIPSFDGVAESVQEGLYAGAIAVLNRLESNQIICGELTDVVWTNSISPSPSSLVNSIQQALSKLESFDPQPQKKHIEKNWSVDVTAVNLLNVFRSLSED